MRILISLGALVGMLAIAVGTAKTNPPPAQTTPEHIDRLVQQLGASKFAERERAQRDLEAIGPPALERLRKAAGGSDPETNRRAGELVQKLEAVVLAGKLLAPKRVKLNLKNQSVLAAVAELQRQSGYRIHVAGDRAALAKRTLTLATGEVSFWEAFDALCREGHLVDKGHLPVRPEVPPGQRLQVRPQPAAPAPPAVAPAAGPLDPFPGFQEYSNAGSLVVSDGDPVSSATCYAGAVRIRALPPTPARQPANGAATVLALQITLEPHLKEVTIHGTPSIRKACDDQGQLLAVIAPVVTHVQLVDGDRSALVTSLALKHGERPATELKQLQGVFALDMIAPAEPLVEVPKILHAAGQTVKGKDGGALEVMAINKLEGGEYQVQVRMTNLAGGNPAANLRPGRQVQWQQVQGQVQFQVVGRGGRGRFMGTSSYRGKLPSLEDAEGKPLELVQVPRRSLQANNLAVTEEATLLYRQQPGQGEPARLVLRGQRRVTLPVTFTLANVPLR